MDRLAVVAFTRCMNDTTNTPTNPTANPIANPIANEMTLVLGGTGKTGRRVAERLLALGRPVRIGSRSGRPPFVWEDAGTWAAALSGISAAYVSYYPDLSFPGAADTIGAFAEAAVASGVRRLVLLSGRGEEDAEPAERAVQASGAEWTVLRGAWFSQNFSEHFLADPVREGVVVLPAGDVAEPFLDAEDVADVAVAALTTDAHIGIVYELTGQRLLTFHDATAEISRALGREVRYVPVPTSEYESAALAAGVPAEEVEPLIELFERVLDGHNAFVTDGVERALGRPPRDFAEYAARTAASGAWNVAVAR
jgi:uncharacterized protein YbjT (DUF2867 family)